MSFDLWALYRLSMTPHKLGNLASHKEKQNRKTPIFFVTYSGWFLVLHNQRFSARNGQISLLYSPRAFVSHYKRFGVLIALTISRIVDGPSLVK